jgi:ribosomal protein S18 acetylase RimI-like enzyme
VDAMTPELAISILPAYRNMGIGTMLLAGLHQELHERGYGQISLSVQKANPAGNLYARLGYRIVGENAEDCIMVKSLAE